jgi:hypothetical protein
MHYWILFWTVAVLVAGLSFAFVTVVVTIRGGRDLRDMFTRLKDQKDHDPSGN